MKKNQHYVFRNYLQPWSKKNIIKTTTRGRDIKVNLTGVAQERYFYEVSELEKADFDFIWNYAIKPLSGELAELNMGWFKGFLLVQRLKDDLRSKGLYKGDAKELIDSYYKESQEEIHSNIESGGIPLISMLREKNLSFYDDEKLRARFCHFLCVQYFRTKKYKERFTNLSKEITTLRFEKTWSFISHVYATNVGFSIFRERYKFILLTHDCDTLFITSDQPVINLLADQAINPEQYDIELFYPVSPEVALLVTNSTLYENKQILKLDESEVGKYNEQIKMQSNEFVFYK